MSRLSSWWRFSLPLTRGCVINEKVCIFNIITAIATGIISGYQRLWLYHRRSHKNPAYSYDYRSRKNVTLEEAYQLFMLSSKWVHTVDVRTPQEYDGGHLLDAVNIDFKSADFKERVNRLYKDES
jgi:3-mercaptopyruvate sulfurtransferase SseA